ncbi:MAG: PIN domain-containing protein [Verrucomicrobiales bacterium]|nr:PIN domain-containing protein [Verrucomicrobiales bacterium]
MRIYADICTLCRPFDDQAQPRIWLETHALCVILDLVESGRLEMIRSPIHQLENSKSPHPFRQHWVNQCLSLATIIAPLSEAIRARANELQTSGLFPMDSLHAAAAESQSSDALVTCDDRFRRRYSGPMRVLNPADFVVEFFNQSPP